MRSLICKRPFVLEYSDIDEPKLKAGYAKVRVKRVGVCGTDLHAYEGRQPYFSYPRRLGHELSGDIVECGEVPGFAPGDKVTIVPYFSCGICIACTSGKPNCCVNLKVFGVHIDGGMADYITVPISSLVKGDDLSYDQLALIEPLAIGAHGVNRAGVKNGEYVLVLGAGPIGLGTIEFVRVAGGRVIVLDIIEDRLHFCQEKLKVEYVLNGSYDGVYNRLMEITHGNMPTVVIDATGSQTAINGALTYLAHGGRFVLIGLQKNELIFSHPEFHKREATLMSSRNATRRDFEQVMGCMRSEAIDPLHFITHRVAFDNATHLFDDWLTGNRAVIKAMVDFDSF